MATAFDTALSGAETTVIGFATTALPIVGAVAAAWLGVRYVKKVIRGL